MRIKTLYEDAIDSVEYSLITEAVRFGSKQRELLEKHQRDFKLGLEYEFHLRRDVVGSISNNPLDYMDEAKEQVQSQLDSELIEAIKPLAYLIDVMSMELPSQDDIQEMIEDAQTGDPSLLQSAMDTLTEPDVKEAIRRTISNNIIGEAYPMVQRECGILSSYLPYFESSAEQAMAAFNQLQMPHFYELLDEVDDASPSDIVQNMIKAIRSNRRHEGFEWYQNEMDARARVKAEELMNIPTMGHEEQYIEWVKNAIDSSMKSMIEKIEEDTSVPEGVEVVSRPLPLRDAMILMKYMFDFISKYGYTSNKTGLHVNISLRSFGDIDPLQVMTLMDSDFFQNYSMAEAGSRKDIVKWEVRNEMVERNSSKLTKEALINLADAYVDGGTQALEDAMRGYLTGGLDPKFRAINWSHFLKHYDPGQRRIEFRFFGGAEYEHRLEEIIGDTMYICYVILAASQKAHTQDHLKGMLRILDRATKRQYQGMGFGQLINQRKAA